MSFGAPSPPKAQPVTPVPQEDDPSSFEARRKAAVAAQGREGDSAHLLKSTGTSTDMADADGTKRKSATLA